MDEKQINEIYGLICQYHKQYLKQSGVALPRLFNKSNGEYTKDALVLIYLAVNYPNTNVVTKDELTRFIQKYYPNTNDVQQARHLAAQKGWYILSGTRKDPGLNPGEYKLKTLEQYYPGFTKERRVFSEDDDYFESLKKTYGYCCATCGSIEGKPHRYWKNTITVLQKGHMDPSKPLEDGNIIPQCEKCNRADRNNWIYDAKGRVISIANPKVIDNCSLEVKREIFNRLEKQLKDK